jgi:hypothetical protein
MERNKMQNIENQVKELLQASHDNALAIALSRASVADAIETGTANGRKALKALYANNRKSQDFAVLAEQAVANLSVESVKSAGTFSEQVESEEESAENQMTV